MGQPVVCDAGGVMVGFSCHRCADGYPARREKRGRHPCQSRRTPLWSGLVINRQRLCEWPELHSLRHLCTRPQVAPPGRPEQHLAHPAAGSLLPTGQRRQQRPRCHHEAGQARQTSGAGSVLRTALLCACYSAPRSGKPLAIQYWHPLVTRGSCTGDAAGPEKEALLTTVDANLIYLMKPDSKKSTKVRQRASSCSRFLLSLSGLFVRSRYRLYFSCDTGVSWPGQHGSIPTLAAAAECDSLGGDRSEHTARASLCAGGLAPGRTSWMGPTLPARFGVYVSRLGPRGRPQPSACKSHWCTTESSWTTCITPR